MLEETGISVQVVAWKFPVKGDEGNFYKIHKKWSESI